jgi:1,2-diacylglycerol 3-beta-glucosyltransferase
MTRGRLAAWSLCLAMLTLVVMSALTTGAASAMDGAGHDITVSRVDVSRPGMVGTVVTLPRGTTADDQLAVEARARTGSASSSVPAQVRRLSPQDLEVVLVPETDADDALLAAQRAALSQLVAAVPGRTRMAVFDGDPQAPVTEGSATRTAEPGRSPSPASQLSEDPARAIVAVAELARRKTYATPGERLEAALAEFSPGPTVRRTLVLVTSRPRPEPAGLVDHLRRRLLASGTQLFVIDLAATPSALDALASSSGGSAARPQSLPSASTPLAALAPGVVDALNRQVYLRFRYVDRLPATVTLEVTVAGKTYHRRVDLPATNPLAPAPWVFPPVPAVPQGPHALDVVLLGLSAALVLSSLAYGAGMLVVSFREPAPRPSRRVDLPRIWEKSVRGQGSVFFVFLLPCLNEDKVILASVERLLSIPGDNYAVMVIDDGSDDATADVVGAMTGQRVWLLRRTAPDARQGKGEALNAAIRELVGSGLLAGRDHDDVVVVVVDADGRLDPQAVAAVTPAFDDPSTGAVQIGVRINNRFTSRLARMQDMEFVIYTNVFQRGRRHLGSVGMGGNGQFMRLSALLSLGSEPWSRSLTEDLDLGVRLLSQGWRNEFCSSVAVHQQGVVQVRRLVRQRTRWFQGHMQSWRLVPIILRATPSPARADLLYHLSSPALLLVASLLTTSFLVSLVGSVLLAVAGGNPWTPWFVSAYVLAFGPSCAYGYVYWLAERAEGVSLLRVLAWAHLYVVYGLMWYAAGWRAVGRILRRQSGWAKTERSAEPGLINSTAATGSSSDAIGTRELGTSIAAAPIRHSVQTLRHSVQTPDPAADSRQRDLVPVQPGPPGEDVPHIPGPPANATGPVELPLPAPPPDAASDHTLDELEADVDALSRDIDNLAAVVQALMTDIESSLPVRAASRRQPDLVVDLRPYASGELVHGEAVQQVESADDVEPAGNDGSPAQVERAARVMP